jgi:radical SAM superfamily enzyme YgiQ (UPF0313 family)
MKICLVLHKYDLPIDDPCCYPLGFMYVSAVLKQKGHDVKVLNYNLFNFEHKKEIEGCDVVMFTGFEEFYPYIVRDAAICRSMGIKTILGGALATFRPDLMLEHVDTVVLGEGEEVLEKALKEKGKILGEKPDLDRLPYPDYEGFGIDEYNKRHKIHYMGVLTSRGCLYNCSFCSHTCRFQNRNLCGVFAEMLTYKEKYGISHIVFNDNTLNLSMGRFINICEVMLCLDITWSGAIRLDRWNDRMAEAAKISGCQYLVVGIESFNQKKLDMMNKKITVEQIKRSLDILEKYDIKYHGNVLFGFEGETADDIFNELEMIPLRYSVYPAMVRPFIGTRDGKDHGLSQDEWNYFNDRFNKYILSSGKYTYPDLQEAI